MKRINISLTLLLLCAPLASAQVSVETSSDLTAEVTGGLQIALDGNWTNNGTLTPGGSTVTLNGSGTQTITNASGSFDKLTIDKSGGEAQAAGNFTVENKLTLNSGDLDLTGNVITLGVEALLAETPGNTVKGATGYIETTRNLNSPNENVAGLGFEISSSANLGSTVIKRGHAQQSGNSNQSILRYFDVTPTNNSGLDATLAFHYDESELDGQTEADLSLYKSEDSGSSWSAEGGTANGTANTVSQSNVASLSRWTVADQPLAATAVIASAGPDVSICAGSSIAIGGSPTASDGQAPYSYSWSPATGLDDATIANPTASPAATTQYIVTVTDANNQTAKDTVVVTINPVPVANAGADKNIAPGGNVQIGGSPTATSGTAPYSYSWTPGAGLNNDAIANPTASPASTTEYIVVVTDANGCSDSDTVLVTVSAALAASAGPDVSICDGSSTQIGGSPTASDGQAPYSYSWNPAAGLDNAAIANPTASPSATTQYIVTVTDANSQTDKDTVVVTIYPELMVSAGPDQSIAGGSSVQIGGSPTASDGQSPYSYSWSPATGLDNATIANPTATPSATTDYIVTVTDANDCIKMDTVTVEVLDPCELSTVITIAVNEIDLLLEDPNLPPDAATELEAAQADLALALYYLENGDRQNANIALQSGWEHGEEAMDEGADFSHALDALVGPARELAVCTIATAAPLAQGNPTLQAAINYAQNQLDAGDDDLDDDHKFLAIEHYLAAHASAQFVIDQAGGGNSLMMPALAKGVARASGSVPTQLTELRAMPDGETVRITWGTVTETANAGFYLYRAERKIEDMKKVKSRKKDGLPNDKEYKLVDKALISGAGASDRVRGYGFTDEKVKRDYVYYYKVAQVSVVPTDGGRGFREQEILYGAFSAVVTGKAGRLGKESEMPNAATLPALALPAEFALEQNYPNPFNPETRIRFALPQASSVKLVVYNLLGQKIRTLVDDDKPAGSHEIIWNARDEFGRPVASGIYIYRIIAGEFSQVRKLTLVR